MVWPCGEDDPRIAKREEVVDGFRKGKFKLLALTETVERKWGGFMV